MKFRVHLREGRSGEHLPVEVEAHCEPEAIAAAMIQYEYCDYISMEIWSPEGGCYLPVVVSSGRFEN